MTERERLIELLKCGLMEHIGKSCNLAENLADHLLANGVMLVDTDAACFVTNREPIRTAFGMPLDELAELIRAKQEGRIIVPPCKVGQTVYKVVNDKRVKTPYECKVVGFWYSKDENCNNASLVRYVNGAFYCSFAVPFATFGKTVFLAKEEAEKALAERSRG